MKESLFEIYDRLQQIKAPADQCAYLQACIACEGEDTQRRRELTKRLRRAKTSQIQQELKKKRVRKHEHA